MTRLTIHKSIFESHGYSTKNNLYIGLLTRMWLWCPFNKHYGYHTLYVKDRDNWKYVCDECNVINEWVD